MWVKAAVLHGVATLTAMVWYAVENPDPTPADGATFVGIFALGTLWTLGAAYHYSPDEDCAPEWQDGELGVTYVLRCEAWTLATPLVVAGGGAVALAKYVWEHRPRVRWLFRRKGSKKLTYEEWKERNG